MVYKQQHCIMKKKRRINFYVNGQIKFLVLFLMLGLGVVKNKSMLLYIFFLIKNSAK